MTGWLALAFAGVIILQPGHYKEIAQDNALIADPNIPDQKLLTLTCTPAQEGVGQMRYYHSSVTPYTDPEQHYAVRWVQIMTSSATREHCRHISLTKIWYPGVHYFMIRQYKGGNTRFEGELLHESPHHKLIVIDPERGPKPLPLRLRWSNQ